MSNGKTSTIENITIVLFSIFCCIVTFLVGKNVLNLFHYYPTLSELFIIVGSIISIYSSLIVIFIFILNKQNTNSQEEEQYDN